MQDEVDLSKWYAGPGKEIKTSARDWASKEHIRHLSRMGQEKTKQLQVLIHL